MQQLSSRHQIVHDNPESFLLMPVAPGGGIDHQRHPAIALSSGLLWSFRASWSIAVSAQSRVCKTLQSIIGNCCRDVNTKQQQLLRVFRYGRKPLCCSVMIVIARSGWGGGGGGGGAYRCLAPVCRPTTCCIYVASTVVIRSVNGLVQEWKHGDGGGRGRWSFCCP